jgi:GDP-L-fucose synthase
MNKDSWIYVAGHEGLVGSAIVEELKRRGYNNLLLKTHKELDLCSQMETLNFFYDHKPEYVFLAAAKVGGIKANDIFPGSFIYQNLMIQTNVMSAASAYGVNKLVFLGSSCIYPRNARQPIKEEYLLTGPLEETNYAYATAKIAGIQMARAYRKQYGNNFICAMPTNLYGENDNFDKEYGHVIGSLIPKFYEARYKGTIVPLLGTGSARREFLYVRDLAEALVFLMLNYDGEGIINIGTGNDVSISELVEIIAELFDYNKYVFNLDPRMDGTPRKRLNVSKINNMGWKARTPLKEGLRRVIKRYSERMGGY